MKKQFISIFLLLTIIVPMKAQSIKECYEYMKKKGADPKEYIFNTFKKTDVIILGERDHRDTTQYNFILDLLSDPRFANEIGYVYTEVGVFNMNDEANSLIKGEYASHDDFYKAFIQFHRNEDYNPLWDKYNRYQFINGLYNINRKLPFEKKITIGLTDIRWDWKENKTHKELYQETVNVDRDEIMANNFLTLYHRQKPLRGKRKALLITNQPHAVIDIKDRSEGYYIKQQLRKKVKIILLNWYDFTIEKGLYGDGAWDAAFEKYNKIPVAVSFHKSPFGKTKSPDRYRHISNWSKLADGMIFYMPFYQFVGAIGGIPGTIDKEFVNEYNTRFKLCLKAYGREEVDDWEYDELDSYYNKLMILNTSNINAQKEQMQSIIEKEESQTIK